MCRHARSAEHQQAMIVEIFVAARRTEALEVLRRRAGVKMHGEKLALDEIGLRRQSQPYRNVSLAHRKIELLLRGHRRDANVGIELEKFAEPWCEPMHA